MLHVNITCDLWYKLHCKFGKCYAHTISLPKFVTILDHKLRHVCKFMYPHMDTPFTKGENQNKLNFYPFSLPTNDKSFVLIKFWLKDIYSECSNNFTNVDFSLFMVGPYIMVYLLEARIYWMAGFIHQFSNLCCYFQFGIYN